MNIEKVHSFQQMQIAFYLDQLLERLWDCTQLPLRSLCIEDHRVSSLCSTYSVELLGITIHCSCKDNFKKNTFSYHCSLWSQLDSFQVIATFNNQYYFIVEQSVLQECKICGNTLIKSHTSSSQYFSSHEWWILEHLQTLPALSELSQWRSKSHVQHPPASFLRQECTATEQWLMSSLWGQLTQEFSWKLAYTSLNSFSVVTMSVDHLISFNGFGLFVLLSSACGWCFHCCPEWFVAF